jgi:hypothetical protein
MWITELLMLRGFLRFSRSVVLVLASASLLSPVAGASEILIDGFGAFPDSDLPLSATPMVGTPGGGFASFGTGTFNYVAGMGVTLEYILVSPFDLTDAGSNNALLFSGLFLIPPTGPLNVKVTLFDSEMESSAATLSGLTFVVPGPQEVPVSFASFMGNVNFEFEDVQKLRFEFTSLANVALSIDEITAVPEPSTATLLGFGLVGLALAGRRRSA